MPDFQFSLSPYWILLIIVLAAIVHLSILSKEDRGGMMSGLPYLFALLFWAVVFFVALSIIMFIHIQSK